MTQNAPAIKSALPLRRLNPFLPRLRDWLLHYVCLHWVQQCCSWIMLKRRRGTNNLSAQTWSFYLF